MEAEICAYVIVQGMPTGFDRFGEGKDDQGTAFFVAEGAEGLPAFADLVRLQNIGAEALFCLIEDRGGCRD